MVWERLCVANHLSLSIGELRIRGGNGDSVIDSKFTMTATALFFLTVTVE